MTSNTHRTFFAAALCGAALLAGAPALAATQEGAVGAATVTAAVNKAPELNLRVSYFTRTVGNDGVQRDTRYTNRMYRRQGMVWTEREMPAGLKESLTHGHEHGHGPHAGHAHDEAQGAPLRVRRDADGTEHVEVVLEKTRRVIEVDRAHHGNVGYGGSWDAAYWLVTPASFWGQLGAFALFRLFDAVKVGPMAWADKTFKGFGPRGGFGILLDDFAAALCTLLVIAVWRY